MSTSAPTTSMQPRPPLALIAIIFLLSLIEFLQSGMTAFAAQPIMGETGMAPEEFSLVAAAYASVAIFAISMQRWFVERIGGRRFVQGCSALALLGAAVCAGSSHSFAGFLTGRLLMALGGGAFFTASRMIIHHCLAGRARFVGISALATGVALGIAGAPWLAAMAVSHESWSAIYGMVGALAVMIGLLAMCLPLAPITTGAPRSQAHLGAQLVLVGSSFALLYALQRLSYDFFGNVMAAGLCGALAVAGIVFWMRHQHRADTPLLHVRRLMHPRYLFGLGVFAFAYLMLGANNSVVPALLQGTMGFAWEAVGHIEALGLAMAIVTWIAMSRLLPRYPSPRKFLLVGFAALAGFGVCLARITTDANPWIDVLPALALNSIFLLTVLPVTAMQTFREIEQEESVFSHAQQFKNMMAQAAIAAGITLATVGQQWRTAMHYTALSEHLSAANPVFQQTLDTLQRAMGGDANAAVARLGQMLAQQAAMLGHIDHFLAVAALGLVAMAVIGVQRVFR